MGRITFWISHTSTAARSQDMVSGTWNRRLDDCVGLRRRPGVVMEVRHNRGLGVVVEFVRSVGCLTGREGGSALVWCD